MRKIALAALLACPAWAGASAGVDCTDPYILARKVPECAEVQAAAAAAEETELEQARVLLERAKATLEQARAEKEQAAQARVRGVIGGAAVNFDGLGEHSGEAVAAEAANAAPQGSELAAAAPQQGPTGAPVPSPETQGPTRGEQARFLGAQTAFHAAWLADLASTIKILKAGGFEMNPLYTLFGAKSLAGVVFSIVAVHLLVTGLLWLLYKKMTKLQGAERRRQELIVLLVSLIAAGVHVFGAVHNAGVPH